MSRKKKKHKKESKNHERAEIERRELKEVSYGIDAAYKRTGNYRFIKHPDYSQLLFHSIFAFLLYAAALGILVFFIYSVFLKQFWLKW